MESKKALFIAVASLFLALIAAVSFSGCLDTHDHGHVHGPDCDHDHDDHDHDDDCCDDDHDHDDDCCDDDDDHVHAGDCC